MKNHSTINGRPVEPTPRDPEQYIILDKEGGTCYWSEEEGGRFSAGALYEKTFATEQQARDYIHENGIDGYEAKHSEHWTYKSPFLMTVNFIDK